MLVLSRRMGESFMIGDQIVVTVVKIANGGVRIGIEAPSHYSVLRQELVTVAEHARAHERMAPDDPPTP